MRNKRPVIAIHEVTGERKDYDGVYSCAKEMKISNSAVIISLSTGTAIKGWKVYDTPENIRKRIQVLEEQIKIVESNED